MQRVGAVLAQKAVTAQAPDEADVFGRSAFNRYYYATYLITRAMLRQLDASWSRIPHKDIPPLLNGKVVERVRRVSRKQQQQGLINDAASLCYSVTSAASALADMMTGAHEVRRVADYEPETQILRTGKVIKLVDHSIEEAKDWPRRASAHSGTILKTWRRLGLC
jgi:hypothetical protein